MMAESVLGDDNSVSIQDETSDLTVPDIIYASPVATTSAPSLHSSTCHNTLIISQSLPSIDDFLPGDEVCVPNNVPPSKPTLDASVPIIEIFPGDLDSDDEDSGAESLGSGPHPGQDGGGPELQ